MRSDSERTLSIVEPILTASQGDLISIASTMSGAGTAVLTITDSTLLGNAAKVKVFATILKTSVNQKIKTTQLMKQVDGMEDSYKQVFLDYPIPRQIVEALQKVQS